MKNAAHTYRMKIGRNVRMLYRVLTQQKRVELLGIGTRARSYGGPILVTNSAIHLP